MPAEHCEVHGTVFPLQGDVLREPGLVVRKALNRNAKETIAAPGENSDVYDSIG
jgi:hypothetical protein